MVLMGTYVLPILRTKKPKTEKLFTKKLWMTSNERSVIKEKLHLYGTIWKSTKGVFRPG